LNRVFTKIQSAAAHLACIKDDALCRNKKQLNLSANKCLAGGKSITELYKGGFVYMPIKAMYLTVAFLSPVVKQTCKR